MIDLLFNKLCMNNTEFIKIKLFDSENMCKLRLNVLEWDEIINDRLLLYNAIINKLLDKTNLFYYATQNESTKTLYETKEYINKIINNNLLEERVDQIFNNIGWGKLDDNIINNTVFQGDIAEYLMCILLDKITNIKTIIAKVSLKTSPQMPSYGNDNIFYDYEKKTLYLGESKFYSDTKIALKNALNSIKNHSKVNEFNYIAQHTNHIIAENGDKRTEIIEKLENVSLNAISISYIAFIVNDDIYEKQDYERKINEFLSKNQIISDYKNCILLVFLPVLSKNEFLQEFLKRVNNGRI